jgi:hypothetical protein
MQTPSAPARPFLHTKLSGFVALFIVFGVSSILSRELDVDESPAPPLPMLKMVPLIDYTDTAFAGFDDLVTLLQAQFGPTLQACAQSAERSANSNRGRKVTRPTDKFRCILTATLNHFRSLVLGRRNGSSPNG